MQVLNDNPEPRDPTRLRMVLGLSILFWIALGGCLYHLFWKN